MTWAADPFSNLKTKSDFLIDGKPPELSELVENPVGNQPVPEFKKFVLPLVRRAFPQLIAADLVGVQPMTAPVGAVFFNKFRYKNEIYAPAVIIIKRAVFGQIGGRILGEPADERPEPTIWTPEPEPPRKTYIFVPSNFGTFPIRHLDA